MAPVKNDNLIQFRAAPGDYNIHGPTMEDLACRVGPDSSGVPSLAKAAALSLRRYFNLCAASLAQAAIAEDGPELALLERYARKGALVSAATSNPEFLALFLARLLDEQRDDEELQTLRPLVEQMMENLALTYAVHDAVERRLFASVRPPVVKTTRECGCPIGTDYRIVSRDNAGRRAEAGDADAITVCSGCGEQIEL